MSTRNSIATLFGLHIFEEVMSEDICVDDGGNYEYDCGYVLNSKYDKPIISLEQLIRFRDDISEFIEYKKRTKK